MGNDGGSIPRRNEMVREKKKDEKADRKNQAIALNFFCALSKQPLEQPIVGDELGRLYNREAILEYLLDRSAFGDGHTICENIQCLKDVKTLNVTPNPAALNSERQQANGGKKPALLSFDAQPTSRFLCPITMKEMNGNMPFEFIWSCGCVFSAQARKELPTSTTCIVCDKPYDLVDVIPINSQDSKVADELRERMRARREAREDKKRAAKSKSKPKSKRKLDVSGSVEEVNIAVAGPADAPLPSSPLASKAGVKGAKVQKTMA
ncbi:Replication termination factor 2 [Coemansia thaxteri]|uniref:Replication termination factor 2 n=1 Tax=Coemansia thaxteri TaxID=2663907 RepID=A0A9W8BJS5_9FUNG|nr:Replication termination factor 2 [Coemansia thaxteri]